MADDERRLGDLLREPRETLDIEIKDWLDLTNRSHQALVAKAAIALANHGGGFILVGFSRTGDYFVPGAGRPQSLAMFNQDAINGIMHRYAEPPFHCDLRIVSQPGTDERFPVRAIG
jgi:predicted HTH transcriptional regulator